MSKLEVILVVTLIFVLVLWLSALSYFIVKIYVNGNKSRTSNSIENIDKIDLPSFQMANHQFQTNFFNKSSEHAQKILFGQSLDPQYGESNYYGNRLMDTIGKLNNESKSSLLTAIKYLSIEPSQARINEQMFRSMSDQEKVPLWFIILRESAKKVIPELMQDQDTSFQDNIVPLFQKTG